MSHKAIIAVVTAVTQIPGADKIHVATVLGENVIVSKDVQVGYVGILFPADLQLSEEYCFENSLNRKAELNKDPTKAGFFEASRRVRVQPFLKVKSQAYFADIKSVLYASENNETMEWPIGYSFDTLNGKQICQKYISQATRDKIAKEGKPKQAKKDFAPFFEKHRDTDQFKHNVELIPKGALLSFHNKVHGTSHRSSYTKLAVDLPKWKQFVNRYINLFPEYEWGYVVGTRNTVLTEKKDGFHGSEQFRFDVAEMLKPYMEKGMSIYGEIAGYTNGRPIMAVHQSSATKDKTFQKKYGKDIIYKYGCKEHEYRFHVYRITYLTPDGNNVDFSQKQLERWCADRGINSTNEVAPQEIYNGDAEALRVKVEALTERPDEMSADVIDSSHPTEGVVIRIDHGGMIPKFLKSKSYYFRTMEGLCEAADTEDAA